MSLATWVAGACLCASTEDPSSAAPPAPSASARDTAVTSATASESSAEWTPVADSAGVTVGAAPSETPAPGPPPAEPHRDPPLVPLRDGTHMVTTFFSDAWSIVTSPTRMTRRDALLLAGVVTVAGVTYANDQAILDAFDRNRSAKVYDLALEPGRAIEPVGNMGNTLAYYFAGMGVGYALRIDPLREISSELIESHFISGGIRNVAEVLVGRYRPFEDRGPRAFAPGKATSFPSGHASSIMEVATILSHHAHSKPVSVLLYGAALSSLLERVDSHSHWTSDVWVGAMTGLFVSKSVLRLHEGRRAAVEPTLGWNDDHMMMGVRMSW